MQPDVIETLRGLNQKFYQSFGAPFASSRPRVQPGVARVMASIPAQAALLDLGCGHGHLAAFLAAAGHKGTYLGLDSSAALLDIARQQAIHPQADFRLADLYSPDWGRPLRNTYDIVTAFAVLHHIAGEESRLSIVRRVRTLLKPRGRFIFSCWNFLASERLRKRIQPWSNIDLTEDDVDAGDYLLDWRSGGHGFRYVHHYTERELTSLAAQSGFRVHATSYHDGASGKLGLYQEWCPD